MAGRSRGTAQHRLLMHSNYAAFAAQFAPMVSAAQPPRRGPAAPLLVAVPIGMGEECCALIPLKARRLRAALSARSVPLPRADAGPRAPSSRSTRSPS